MLKINRLINNSNSYYCNNIIKSFGFYTTTTTNNNNNNGKSKVITSKEVGKEGTFEYRVNFYNGNNEQISPWHRIPMIHSGKGIGELFNFLVEMPKATTAKMELCTSELHNPIKQDIKKGELRFIKHGPIPFNYGCIPQTWEDPNQPDEYTSLPGDNDPIDVVEVSDVPFKRGSIRPIRVLGALPLIDEGETDWKVIAIAFDHKHFNKIYTLEQLEEIQPGTIEKIKDWYQYYKVSEGKPANEWALNGVPLNANLAKEVIQTTHDHWKQLINSSSLLSSSSIPDENLNFYFK